MGSLSFMIYWSAKRPEKLEAKSHQLLKKKFLIGVENIYWKSSGKIKRCEVHEYFTNA